MSALNTNSILVVDDEPLITTILKIQLEESGYLVNTATDGDSCLAILAKQSFDLILLDIWMPNMSGVQLLDMIIKSGCDAAIIMMSGHGSENLAVNCMKNGAMDYFTKPFELNDVLQRVQQALGNRNTLLQKQRLEQEKNDFVSMLSHDMKNPLTAVIGSIDIIKEGRLGPVTESQSEFLQCAIDNCNEVVAMIDNLLDIHRFEAGQMHLNIQPNNLTDVLSATIDRFTMMAERENINLKFVSNGETPLVPLDANAFPRVVANLLSNALRFSPENGSISISLTTLPAAHVAEIKIPDYAHINIQQLQDHCSQIVKIAVKDEGFGIHEEDQEFIFERYVQSRKNKRERVGTGLGLAYCKMTVNSLGGTIWVESEPGKGSEFILLLPASNCID